PSAGPTSGCTTVTVFGQGYLNSSDLLCAFGTTATPGVFVDASQVLCRTPKLEKSVIAEGGDASPVTVALKVSNNGVTYSREELEFLYAPEATVSAVSPRVVSIEDVASGSAVVSISGTGFVHLLVTNTTCRFSGIGDSLAVLVRPTLITCRLPTADAPPGVVTVSVSLNGHDFPASERGVSLALVMAPRAGSLFPGTGPSSGGTLVQVFGDNFDGDVDPLVCTFQFGVEALVDVAAEYDGSGSVRCTTPPLPIAGEETNMQMAPNGSSVTPGVEFAYYTTPKVSSLAPQTGPAGTLVGVSGEGFVDTAGLTCRFGDTTVTPIEYKSDKVVVCRAPRRNSDEGIAAVGISNNMVDWTTSKVAFAYRPRAVIESITPKVGPVNGSTIVRVVGSNFPASEIGRSSGGGISEGSTANISCRFGSVLVPATVASTVDSGELFCVSPATGTPGSVSLEVVENGLDVTDSGWRFDYIPDANVTGAYPLTGPEGGSTKVTITGPGFLGSETVVCQFGEAGYRVSGRWVGRTSFVCETPPQRPGSVRLAISTNGQQFTDARLVFSYQPQAAVLSVSPRSGLVHGGTVVSVRGAGFVNSTEIACLFGDCIGDAEYLDPTLVLCRAPAAENVSHNDGISSVPVRIANNGVDFTDSDGPGVMFEYVPSYELLSVGPAGGPMTGGTTLRVEGVGFGAAGNLSCVVNGLQIETVLETTGHLTCVTPPAPNAGVVDVRLTNNGVEMSSSAARFHYHPPIEVDSVYPTSVGPLSGGTVVRVSGSGFEDATAGSGKKLLCRFGRSVVTAAVTGVSGDALCVVPTYQSVGAVSFEVSMNGVDYTSDGWTFHYSPDINVESAWPLAGPESGGTAVTVTGTGFVGVHAIMCEFGSLGTLVPGRWMDSTTVTCVSPPHMPGAATLRLSVNGQQFVETGLAFQYLIESTVRGITPSSGPQQGGTLVEVDGTGFVNSTGLSCRLAGRRLPATFVDSGRLRCTTPPSTALFPLLAMPLEVSNNGVDFTNSSRGQFSFVPALDIRHLWPMSGPAGGGTSVSVYGTGFSSGTSKVLCIFGAHMTLATVHSDDELSCLTPSLGDSSPTGAVVRVELTNNNGVDRVSSPMDFTYVPPIRLFGVNPSQSGEEGGVTVVVTGENFMPSPSLSCRFGGQDATPAGFISSTRASCLVPESHAGPRQVSLTVSNNGQDFADRSPLVYTYLSAFTVTSNEPTAGPVDGGTEVLLAGTGLSETGPWACVFGENVAVPATQLASGHLRCKSPPQPPGVSKVRVFRSPSPLASAVSGAIAAAATGSLRDFGLGFDYQGTVYISSVEPRSGPAAGGTPVTLRGFGFGNSSSTLTCGFGEQNGQMLRSPALRASPGVAVCSSPPRDNPSVVSVTLSLNGADFTSRGPQYIYYEPVEVLGLFPAVGSVNGGTVITVVGRHFLPSETLSCRFGSFEPSPGEFMSSDLIRCTAPPSPDGPIKVEVSVSNNLLEFSTPSAATTFEYYPQARPERIHPEAGPLSGGTVITVEGGTFSAATAQLACRFGRVVAKAALQSPTQIICRAPPSSSEKNVLVQVTINGEEWEDVGFGGGLVFRYYQAPEVEALHPSTGPPVAITVTGEGFLNLPTLACRFGLANSSQPAEFVSSQHIQCFTPAESEPGTVHVEVTLNGVDYTAQEIRHHFLPTASILRLDPGVGLASGGTPVVIEGSGFDAIGRVEGTRITCQWAIPGLDPREVLVTRADVLSDSALTCLSAPAEQSGGVAYVSIFANDINIADENDNGLAFEYKVRPTTSQLSPTHGRTLGGTRVNVTGEGFTDDGGLTCRFHGVAATDGGSAVEVVEVSASFVSTTEVHCSTPALASVYPQGVENSSTGVGHALSAFTFLPATTVTAVNPSSGPFVSGGGRGQQPILLEGTGFSPVDRPSCSFGEMVVAASEVISATEVRCVPPAMPRLLGSLSKPLSPMYVFYNEPVVASLAPSRGVTSGQASTVLLTGTNFAKRGDASLASEEEDKVLSCRLGPHDNNATTSGVVLSPREATCSVSCGGFSGLTSFEVSLNGGAHWTEADVGFRCDPLPEISSITPEMGPTTGGTALTIRGSGFTSSELLGCRFGLGGTDNVTTMLSKARFISSSVIECVTPAASEASGPHTADVAASNDGIHFSPPAPTAMFEYVPPPMVTRIYPSFASASLREAPVYGTGFVNRTGLLLCRFGETGLVEASFGSSSVVRCPAPAQAEPGAVSVAVSVDGGVTFGEGGSSGLAPVLHFRYLAPSLVTGISPRSGPATGGTVVSVLGTGFNSDFRFTGGLATTAATETVWCRFGSIVTMGARFSDGWVQCLSPPWGVGLPVEAEVSVSVNSGADFERGPPGSPLIFSYEESARVTSLSPAFVSSTGGTRITLKGSGFPRRGDARCRFVEGTPADEQASSPVPPVTTSYAYVISEGELACNVPSSGLGPGEPGSAHVFLATTGDDFRPTNLFVNFVPDMEVSSVVPRQVTEQGEHIVLVEGSNFPDLPDLACRFGGGGETSTAPALWLRSTAVRCVAPPLPPGDVSVQVTFNGIDFVEASQMLMVNAKLTVVGISPQSGPIAGGTEVSVTGTGFGVEGVLGGNITASRYGFACMFGESQVAVVATVISPGSMAFAPTPLVFLYLREAVLTSVTPNSGPMAGGTRVTLSGVPEEISFLRAAGVEPDLRCRFGAGTDATIVLPRGQGDDVFCISPPLVGAVDISSHNVSVTVSFNGGADFVVSEAVFVYFETPEVFSAHPSTVSAAGGTAVTLRGRNFPDTKDGFNCIVGPETQALEGVRVSSTVIECVAPPHAPGLTLISASFNGEDVSASTALLEYREDLQVSSLVPAYAAITSEAEVTLRGTGFVDSSLLCLRWRRHSSAEATDGGPGTKLEKWHTIFLDYINSTAASFTAPYVAAEDNGNEGGSGSVRFAIAGRPRVQSAFPRYGSGAGATTVTIVGTGFVPAATLCRFGSRERNDTYSDRIVDKPLIVVQAEVWNSTHLACVTPTSDGHLIGDFFIEVVTGAATDDDALATATAENVYERLVDPLATAGFTFIPAAGVIAVEPTVLPESGNVVVTIEGDNFTRTGLEACRFGGEVVVGASLWNSSAVRCQAPPLPPSSYSLELTLNGGAEWLTVPVGVRYEPDRFLYSLSPSAGPLSGGSLVTITGVGFVGSSFEENKAVSLYCGFGDLEVLGRALNDSSLQCTSPAVATEEIVPMTVALRYSNTKRTTIMITGTDFRNTPQLVARFAYSGTSGGSGNTIATVTVADDNQSVATTVTVPARYVNSEELMVETPRCPLDSGMSGSFFVEISSNGRDFTPSSDGPLFFYDASEPFVESLSPAVLRESGGVVLTVQGSGFPDTFPSTLVCRFGGGDDAVSVQATRHSPELVTCVSPPRRPGLVGVAILSYDQLLNFDGDLEVEYISNLRLFSSWPALGPAAGGTTVTILGEGFRAEETYACAFGSLQLPSVEAIVVNSSAIQCLSPMVPGSKNVTLQVLTGHDDVITPSESYVDENPILTTYLSFQYHEDVEISRVSPQNGPASGGTVVRVSGLGFIDLPQAACQFGAGEPIPATVISSGTLVCTASSLTASAGHSAPKNAFTNTSRAEKGVEVRVSMNGVDFLPVNSSISFLYDDDMHVSSLVPDHGPATGGVRVLVRGSGFRPDERLACRFGLQESAAEYIRGDAIACLSPPQARVSTVLVSVTLNGQDYSSRRQPTLPLPTDANGEDLGGALFTYTDRAAVTALAPDSGPTRGGTVVTVSGVNFAGSSNLLCRFGDLVMSAAVFLTTETVTCVSPAVPVGAAGPVYLEVDTPSFEAREPGEDPSLWTNSAVEFTFTEDPVVLAAFPMSGPAEGGTRVTLTGSGFQDLPELGCRFGGTTSRTLDGTYNQGGGVVDEPLGAATTSEVGATVRVAVTLNGQDYSLRMAQFTYYPTPKIFSVSPDRGPTSGGTMVTVSGANLASAGT
ncbi:unnamed protein product, partial [Ectocarpus fasciculatus]